MHRTLLDEPANTQRRSGGHVGKLVSNRSAAGWAIGLGRQQGSADCLHIRPTPQQAVQCAEVQ